MEDDTRAPGGRKKFREGTLASPIDAQRSNEAFAVKGRDICHARNQRLPLHDDRAVIRQKNALAGRESPEVPRHTRASKRLGEIREPADSWTDCHGMFLGGLQILDYLTHLFFLVLIAHFVDEMRKDAAAKMDAILDPVAVNAANQKVS